MLGVVRFVVRISSRRGADVLGVCWLRRLAIRFRDRASRRSGPIWHNFLNFAVGQHLCPRNRRWRIVLGLPWPGKGCKRARIGFIAVYGNSQSSPASLDVKANSLYRQRVIVHFAWLDDVNRGRAR